MEWKGRDGFLFVTGSLYLVGELKNFLCIKEAWLMLDFEEELKKFHPSLEVEDAEDAITNQDLTDMADVLIGMIREAKDEE